MPVATEYNVARIRKAPASAAQKSVGIGGQGFEGAVGAVMSKKPELQH